MFKLRFVGLKLSINEHDDDDDDDDDDANRLTRCRGYSLLHLFTMINVR